MREKDLPSLKSLAAFEATLQLGSITAAAAELGISQPLASQRIRALEDMLGCVLIDRSTKPVQATPLGRYFFRQVAGAVSSIDSAVKDVKRRASQSKPKVSIAGEFGITFFWIMPRLQRLQEHFPHVQFEIQPTGSLHDLLMVDADITFLFGQFGGTYKFEKQIIGESVRPVCSREFAEKFKLHPGSYIYETRKYPLLHMDNNNTSWLDWNDWSRILNLPANTEPVPFYFHNYPLLLDAVKAGKGIGLGWAGLIEPMINDGTIVPLGPEITSTNRGYKICSNYYNTHLVQNIIDWFIAEV